MRIRKRQVPVPVPLSSLTPVPLSDPLLHNLNYSPSPPVVQLHTHHDGDDPSSPTQPKPSNPVEKTPRVGHPHPQPSDHHHHRHLNQRLSPIPAGAGKGWGYSDAACGDKHEEHMKKDCGLELLILKGEEDERGSRDGDQKGNDDDDIRKETILGAATLIGFASSGSSSSHPALGRWYEGEKAFPLKKRRGSFQRGGNGETMIMDKKDKKLMKTKMNRKCATQQQQNDDDQKQDDGEAKQGLGHVNVVNSNAGAIRKRGRGGALMEGSRCSRVNGRGWRCCQQTLVGYSLCEHHLGKGRLRSMSSVRSRSMASTTTDTASTETKFKRLSASRSSLEPPPKEDREHVIPLDDHDICEAKSDHDNEVEAEEEQKPLMVTKRRMKLGIVKARSMSSLLGQTNSAFAAVANDDDYVDNT